ncbi:MAG: tetratricopeptide repeat protein [Nitrospira sp.]|nr:tetratricopeptide repeat protein [Nitrospira sp.]
MGKLFISHSSKDDAFVRELRAVLADHGQPGWIDSRELRGGDPLWPEIQSAIDEATAFVVVVSVDALQSKWVGMELIHALEVRKQRGKGMFQVIPLSLNGTKLGMFEQFFGEEPIYIPVSSAAGWVEAAIHPILIALGKRDPADVSPTPQPKVEPLEELVLELTDLKFHEDNGVRRPSARARLVYEPSTPGQREVASVQSWRLIAPIGPIEAGELRWYLEHYAIWPSHYFRDRARKVEDNLVKWGRLLHDAALPMACTANVVNAWSKINDHAGRRFSVHVDAALEAGASDADVKAAKEAATELLKLPWELLHDGDGYLFQGAKPTRVRRRLPNTQTLDVSLVEVPIRILLVTARPEDEACGYIDHRVSALPLVVAMEELGGLVQLHVLNPPTFDGLGKELKRAFDAHEPYHVVHFDGHGVYDRRVGLGGLCFELPEDTGKLDKRRHVTIYTDKLAPLLRDYRIPLVFLEACQTALAEDTSESVASELLQRGVASVVAMSHSVLVETARRFVETFYVGLARGQRVGDAMLDGQHSLKDDSFRGRIFGAGELRLEDWFVPVLFQEKDDPQLFKTTPAKQTVEDFKTALAARLGNLPPVPATGFVGRSRELLALQRLLHHERYAVVRGQGGEGKTALAAEFACWMVRSQQVRRAVFVSVETHSHVAAVLDAIGSQLVGDKYSAATFSNVEQAILPVERALREQATLLVVDNMESILIPPYLETPELLSEEAGRELKAILALCERLLKVGDTRLVFTSREALPAPFDGGQHRRELHQLDREDAVKLVERVLNAAGGDGGGASDVAREQIEQLVETVHCHARTLTLLAPALQERGVEATRTSLVELMEEMDKQIENLPVNDPKRREKSVFASIELSLRRMSKVNRDRARVLGVFHGGIKLEALYYMFQWEEEDVDTLAGELIETGLATRNRYNHLTLTPALCPYLLGQLGSTEREALTARWVQAMCGYASFLSQQKSQNPELAATLTGLELPNLFALLDHVQRSGDAKTSIDLATKLYILLQFSGKPRLLERVGQVRDFEAKRLGELGDPWNHARFKALQTHIDQQLAGGQMREAFEGAQSLLRCAEQMGEHAYPGADFDLATAGWFLAHVQGMAGRAEQALPLLDEVLQRFETIAKDRPYLAAEAMASACITEQGDCLCCLGRMDEATAVYEAAIRRAEQCGDARQVAVAKGQLGFVRMRQWRYQEALEAYAEAIKQFTQLDEPASVATIWRQIGMAYKDVGQPEAAEDAYRKSLIIYVRLNNSPGQANTLAELGLLYDDVLNRPEEAVVFHRQAADKFAEGHAVYREGQVRNDLARTLRKLRRLDEARQEICRSIECEAKVGEASKAWKSWDILANIETDAGNLAVAAEAKGKAIACYLAYRRDGGVNHSYSGHLFHAVAQELQFRQSDTAVQLIDQYCARWKNVGTPEADALKAIVAGNRERTLADAPGLHCTMAAEILFLIEQLEKPR